MPSLKQVSEQTRADGPRLPPIAKAGNHTINGMMSTAVMDKLKTAQGTEASKLVLSHTVAHHKGTLEMARPEVTAGHNANAEAIAKSIVASQESEIKAMKDFPATL